MVTLPDFPDGNPADAVGDAANARLSPFFKSDEAAAFAVWASPLRRFGILLLHFEPRSHAHAIWVAIGPDGQELKKRSELPEPVRRVMKRDDMNDSSLPIWPEDVDLRMQ